MDEKEFDTMNIIPLVDVMLVLLTIVLMTSTFIATGAIPVELPRASTSQGESVQTRTIEIDREGKIYLNSARVTPGELREGIKALDRETPFLIRADKEIALEIFVDVLDAVKGLGFKRMSLQTEQRRGES